MDNVSGIFNSRNNKNYEQYEITPKPVQDDFNQFSNCARIVCAEKMKYL